MDQLVSLAWPFAAIVIAMLVFALLSKIRPTHLKGKVAGQEFDISGVATCPDADVQQEIKSSLHIYRRIDATEREIAVEQKMRAQAFWPFFSRDLADRDKRCRPGDCEAFQLAWLRILGVLQTTAEQNHILDSLRGGEIIPDYLDRKTLEIQVAYGASINLPLWDDVESCVLETFKKFIAASAAISRLKFEALLIELRGLRDSNCKMPNVCAIIDDETAEIVRRLS